MFLIEAVKELYLLYNGLIQHFIELFCNGMTRKTASQHYFSIKKDWMFITQNSMQLKVFIQYKSSLSKGITQKYKVVVAALKYDT